MDDKMVLDDLLTMMSTFNRIGRSLQQAGYGEAVLTLSPMQKQALIAIRRYGVVKMSELAERLCVTKPQLTKLVDALVAEHLVQRQTDPENRRVVLIELSEKGAHFIEEGLLGANSLLSRAFHSISKEEQQELKSSLEAVHRIVSKMEWS